MTPEVRERIEQIRHGNVPGGYKHSAVGVVPADWDVHLISDHLSESYVLGNTGDVAKKITVKLWNRGVCEKKEIHQGSENTQYYRRQKGQFIYSKLDFLNCAFGIIPSELDGYESTQDLPAFDIREINPYYLLAQVTQRRFYERWGIMVANGGRKARRISPDDFLTFPIAFPNRYEQDKIAEILTTQDKVIELEQQKIEEIKKVKKFFLSKMFPKKGQAVPEIRFKGFTDAWEQRKLSTLYAQLNERNNDMLSYDKTLSVATMTYKSDGNGASDSSLTNYKRLRLGDIAFEGHTSKEFRYGRFVLNDVGDGIMSPRFSALRPVGKLPIHFWKYYIHYEPIMRHILVNSTKAGTMMNELVVPEFLGQSVLVPSKQEQQAIGEFFSNLDNLITLHQRKLEEEKQKKKALMQLLLMGIVRV